MAERRSGHNRRAGMVNVKINASGTFRALTDKKSDDIKSECRQIMDAYAESTLAYEAARRVLDILEEK